MNLEENENEKTKFVAVRTDEIIQSEEGTPELELAPLLMITIVAIGNLLLNAKSGEGLLYLGEREQHSVHFV